MCTIGSGAPASWLQHNTFFQQGAPSPFIESSCFQLSPLPTPFGPSPHRVDDSCCELLWAPDIGHKAISEELAGYLETWSETGLHCDRKRGDFAENNKNWAWGHSSSSKCGLCVTWLATTCLCFSIYQKQLGGLNWSWKIIWKSNEATQEKKK